jgi:hypothetical protein
MSQQAALPQAVRRSTLANAGLALCIALAVVFGMIVEGVGALMVESNATWRELAVLGLFAVPLVTGWVAIAITLADRPLGLRLSVAGLLLLVPPAVLFGAFNG